MPRSYLPTRTQKKTQLKLIHLLTIVVIMVEAIVKIRSLCKTVLLIIMYDTWHKCVLNKHFNCGQCKKFLICDSPLIDKNELLFLYKTYDNVNNITEGLKAPTKQFCDIIEMCLTVFEKKKTLLKCSIKPQIPRVRSNYAREGVS